MAQKEVSHKKAAVLGLQHLLAMYSGAVAVPLLIGTALHFNSTQMTYLVSIDIFMCGLATLIQLFRNKYFGIGLPVVLGCAIQAVAPLEMIGQKFSINTMYGAIIVAGIFVFLIAGWFSKIKKLFPPVVTGTLITVIGLTLIPVAFQNMGGGNAQAKDFGDAKNLIAAFITILIIVVIEVWAKGFLRSISVLIGLIVGTLIASCMGLVSLKPVAEASWFHLPQFFYFGGARIRMVILFDHDHHCLSFLGRIHWRLLCHWRPTSSRYHRRRPQKRLSCRRISTNLRRAFQHLPLHYFFSKCRLASIIRH